MVSISRTRPFGGGGGGRNGRNAGIQSVGNYAVNSSYRAFAQGTYDGHGTGDLQSCFPLKQHPNEQREMGTILAYQLITI